MCHTKYRTEQTQRRVNTKAYKNMNEKKNTNQEEKVIHEQILTFKFTYSVFEPYA